MEIMDYKVFMKKGRLLSGKKNEFVCSIPLNRNNNEEELPVNYFTLKNLKSPENLHNYTINDSIEKSKISPAYSLEKSCEASEVVSFIHEVIEPLQKYIDGYTIDPVLNDLVSIAVKQHPYIASSVIFDRFMNLTDRMSDNMFFSAYNEYCKQNYGISVKTEKKTPSLENVQEKLSDLSISFFQNRPTLIKDTTDIQKKLAELLTTALSFSTAEEILEKLKTAVSLIEPAVYKAISQDLTLSSLYLEHYDWLPEYENTMTETGTIDAWRDYNSTSKDMEGDRFLYYRYGNDYDFFLNKEVLEKNNISIISSLPEIYTEENLTAGENYMLLLTKKELTHFLDCKLTSSSDFSQSTTNFSIFSISLGGTPLASSVIEDFFNREPQKEGTTLETLFGEMSLYKVADDKAIIVKTKSKVDCLCKSLKYIQQIQFAERIQGEHYYKVKFRSKVKFLFNSGKEFWRRTQGIYL